MALILDGTNGLSDVDGSAATPAIRGSDANTGVFFGSDVVGLSTGGTERVRVDASGNVGIGTSSPTERLTVSSAGATGLRLVSTAASGADMRVYGSDGSQGLLGTFSNHPVTFYTNSAERARIDSSGNLLVGVTSAAASGSGQLYVTASVNNWYGAAITNNNTNSPYGLLIDMANASNPQQLLIARRAGINRLFIESNGNVLNANNSYGGISDAKLKENVVDATPKLEKLNQIRVVSYNLKSSPEQKLLGVVAQEVEQIFPGMVEETPDRDADNNDLGTTTKAVKYSVFVPMLIKAIQEQQAIINAQQAALEQLKADVAALKGAQG